MNNENIVSERVIVDHPMKTKVKEIINKGKSRIRSFLL